MLIILAVIMAASVMEAAGGIDYLVSLAERIIRRNPRQITLVAPLVCYLFPLGAGTGHVFYPLLPIIYQVAYENGIRPERPLAVSTIASQQAITASPGIGCHGGHDRHVRAAGIGLPQIMMICVPATVLGVIAAALVQTHVGKELADDPEYQRRLAGELCSRRCAEKTGGESEVLPKGARLSALMFLGGVAADRAGWASFPQLAPAVPAKGGARSPRHGGLPSRSSCSR